MGVNQILSSCTGCNVSSRQGLPPVAPNNVLSDTAATSMAETATGACDGELHTAVTGSPRSKIPGYLKPAVVLTFLALWIFLAEMVTMVVFSYFPQVSRIEEVVLDGILLLILISPVYLFVYRPLKVHWEQHNRSEQEIISLGRKLMSSTEEERRRLARDLHDECGGLLAVLQIKMETLKHQALHDPTRTLEQADQAIGILTQLSGNLRGILNGRRQVMLEQFGLAAALGQMAEEYAGYWPGLKVDFHVQGQHRQLGREVEVALFHICQEGLNNAAKYARADRIEICLGREENWVVLSIKDNGRGIAKRGATLHDGSAGKGFGLLSMRERAVILGGTFELLSTLDAGVLVRVRLPLARENAVRENAK
jgi:signal transduction histidine kinase